MFFLDPTIADTERPAYLATAYVAKFLAYGFPIVVFFPSVSVVAIAALALVFAFAGAFLVPKIAYFALAQIYIRSLALAFGVLAGGIVGISAAMAGSVSPASLMLLGGVSVFLVLFHTVYSQSLALLAGCSIAAYLFFSQTPMLMTLGSFGAFIRTFGMAAVLAGCAFYVSMRNATAIVLYGVGLISAVIIG